jgi:sugar lactone lactonase YvrE
LTIDLLPMVRNATGVLIAVLLALPLAAQTPSASGTVLTIAGGGADNGENVPALSATMDHPSGMAFGADGTLYYSDAGHFRVRAIDPTTGLVRTVAGTGVAGNGGSGPATNTPIAGTAGINFDPTGRLLLADASSHKIRRLDFDAGTLEVFAGSPTTFGFFGDGGPATSARLLFAQGVAADAAGNVFIADSLNRRIRRVDAATGIINTIAGTGQSSGFEPTGDNGPALAATFGSPQRVALDAAGNVFIADLGVNGASARVRRIDAATNIITTVFGGGAETSDSGVATDQFLPSALDVTCRDGSIYVSTFLRAYRVDLATNQFTTIAGDGMTGFSGDGGPSLAAQFNRLYGIALSAAGEVFLADNGNDRIRYIVPDGIRLEDNTTQIQLTLPYIASLVDDFIVSGNESLQIISAAALANVEGGVYVDDNDSAVSIDLGSLGEVGGTLEISGNDAATSIDLDSLTSVGQNVTMIGNDSTTTINVDSLTSVGQNVTMNENDSTITINLDSLTSVGQNVTMIGNDATTTINLSSLDSIGGTLEISGNDELTDIDLSTLSSIGVNVTMIGNESATTIDLSALASVGESVTMSGNNAATTIDLSALTDVGLSVTMVGNGSLTTLHSGSLNSVGGTLEIKNNPMLSFFHGASLIEVGGSVVISGNPSATSVAMGSVTDVGGDVVISGNPSATTVDMGSVMDIGGDVVIAGNPSATSVAMGSLTQVGGDVTVVSNTSADVIDLNSLISTGGGMTVAINTVATLLDLDSLISTGGGLSVVSNQSIVAIDLTSLNSVGGSLEISGNNAATYIDLSSLIASSSVNISSNDSAQVVDIGSLADVPGDVIIAGNPSATTVDMGSLESVGGSLEITDNGAATVNFGNLTSVDGDFTVVSTGPDIIDLSSLIVGGSGSIEAINTTTLTGQTAAESTAATLVNGPASMTVMAPDGTFAAPVEFSLHQLTGGDLNPQSGDDEGQDVTVDPLAAYQINFNALSLNQPVSVSFDIALTTLSETERKSILDALTHDALTLAVKGDAPGSEYHLFGLAAEGQPPVLDELVRLLRLDATEMQLPPGSIDDPAILRFDALVSHFSTYAVVTFDSSQPIAGDFNNDGFVNAADYVTWRKNDGSPDGYDLWRANFGKSALDGASAIGSANVPEPSNFAMFLMGVLAVGTCYRLQRM